MFRYSNTIDIIYTNAMKSIRHFQSSFSIVIDLNLNVICTYSKTKGQFKLVWE